MGEAHTNGIARANSLKLLQIFPPSDQLDLSLGLSVGGSSTQIPSEKPLIRTSSLNRSENEGLGFLSLSRSSSLPTEAEQEVRRVKEMQAMKRMEAKKRMLEKHRHSRGGGGGSGSSGGGTGRGHEEVKPPVVAGEGKLSNWAVESATKNTAFCRAIQKLKSNGGSSADLISQGPERSSAVKFPPVSLPLATRVAKENGKSVKFSNYRSEPINFWSRENGKSAYSANYRSMEKVVNGKQVNSANSPHPGFAIPFGKRENGKPVELGKPTKRVKVSNNSDPDRKMVEIMKLMPTVTTTGGDDPNGKKVEGFLYRYKKGQVCIVCVCHGKFLSPAEFVKHAGGGDVAEPMKLINVLPTVL